MSTEQAATPLAAREGAVRILAQTRFIVHAPQDWDDYAVLLRGGGELSEKTWAKLHQAGVSGTVIAQVRRQPQLRM